MIVYDLKCTQGHTFEGWFRGREELENEISSGRLNCPMCGDVEVTVLLTGGHISRSNPDKGNREQGKPAGHSKSLSLLQYIERNFDNVGPRFAEEAIKIHFGEIDAKNIRGTMTEEEEKDLQEEGVEYMKVPLPKFQS
jgi:hypothetical protein